MLTLLRSFTWPSLRRHPFLFAMVTLAIALGVGAYASLSLSDRAMRDAFTQAVAEMSGRCDIKVGTPFTGVSEDKLEEIRALGCVEAAAGIIERSVVSRAPGLPTLAVIGIDLLEEQRFRDYQLSGSASFDDALVFLAQPDSVLINEQLVREGLLHSDSRIPVWNGAQWQELIVRGTLRTEGLARSWGNSLAVMDVFAAQILFGRRGYFDRVDIAVKPGHTVEGCLREVEALLGPGMADTAEAARSRRLTDFSTGWEFLVDVSSLLAGLISLFLIHHGFLVAVVRRERSLGVALALGVSSRQLFTLILAESFVLAVAGSALGIVLGWMAATRLTPLIQQTLHAAAGTMHFAAAVTISPLWVLATVGLASLLSVLAAFSAARRAANLPPIQLMETRRYAPTARQSWWKNLALGGVLLLAAAAFPSLRAPSHTVVAAIGLTAAGLLVLGEAITVGILSLLRPLFTLLWPLEGRLAVDSLRRSGRRSRGMVVSLAAVVSTLLAVTALLATWGTELRHFARETVASDFLIHSSPDLAVNEITYAPELLQQIQAVDGVARVAGSRLLSVNTVGRRCRLFAVDEEPWRLGLEHPYPPFDGGAAISDVLSRFTGLQPGGALPLSTPHGPVNVPIRFVFRDYVSSSGLIAMDRKLFAKLLGETRVDSILVYLSPGADPKTVRAAIQRRLPPDAPALILDGQQLRASLDRIVARWSDLSLAQVVAALPLALLGVTSFLIVSIVERRREFSIMSALGARPGQLAKCVLAEAVALAAAGTLLGFLMAVPLTAYLRLIIREMVMGFDLAGGYPWLAAAAAGAATLLAAILASLFPIRLVNRSGLAVELESDV